MQAGEHFRQWEEVEQLIIGNKLLGLMGGVDMKIGDQPSRWHHPLQPWRTARCQAVQRSATQRCTMFRLFRCLLIIAVLLSGVTARHCCQHQRTANDRSVFSFPPFVNLQIMAMRCISEMLPPRWTMTTLVVEIQ